MSYPRADHVHLENTAVDPAPQGRGLGRALIAFAEQRARHCGFSRIERYSHAKMTDHLAPYPGLGYREFDRRFEDGFDRVCFTEDLV